MVSRTEDYIPTHRVSEWRVRLRSHGVDDVELDRVERTLREQTRRLAGAGLDPDEAFLIAVKRTAGLSAAARECNQAYAERLWRQLVTRSATGIGRLPLRSDLALAAALAVAAAAAIKVPALFGAQFGPAPDGFYARNLGLLVLPLLAALLLCRRRTNLARAVAVGVLFAAGAVFANAFPLSAGGSTAVLTAIHLPIALWAGRRPCPRRGWLADRSGAHAVRALLR